MAFLVVKAVGIARGIYFGLRGILSRFVYENGDYIRLKTELWYEEATRALLNTMKFLVRSARGKSYARKRNVTLVNPWGLPFSSRIHFRDGRDDAM